MRLFISYARVDKRYCEQIVSLLDIYEVWYDQRLHVGQKWWTEILKQLENCDGLVYLLSPESVASEYCQRELNVAKSLSKHIFPILIHPKVEVPENLSEYQFADLSRGLDAQAVKTLLGAIYLASRQVSPDSDVHRDKTLPTAVFREPSVSNEVDMFDKIAKAFDQQDFDKAVFLLKQFKNSDFSSRFIDLDNLLKEAEMALEAQSKRREAEREYVPIRILVQHNHTQILGLKAFEAFQQEFPDYDPDDLSSLLNNDSKKSIQNVISTFFQWCEVPAGEMTCLHRNGFQTNHRVRAFYMSKFPVTNEQFQVFIKAEDGYHCEQWWQFSDSAYQWHLAHPIPLSLRLSSENYPRHNVNWYEAMSFCNWLGCQIGSAVTLPSELEWQRAAQGDDNRAYPWGNEFDATKCNTKESQLRTLVPNAYYPDNVSSFGVCDMVGNIWEWCINGYRKDGNTHDSEMLRAVCGGAFMSPAKPSESLIHYLKPTHRYTSIGFRLIR